jgi:hypothetical protein
MARLALLLLLTVGLAAGCAGLGESQNAGGEPPATTEALAVAEPSPVAEPPPAEPVPTETGGTGPATTATDPGTEAPAAKPPPIVLKSTAGEQVAVQESYCLSDPSAGTGICADTMDLAPDRISVVAPGERISVSLKGPAKGQLNLSARPLGCTDRELVPIDLVDGLWTVDLPPGAYELQAFATFGDGTGPSGDTAGSLGLLVDPDRKPSVVKAKPGLFVCPPSEQG